MTTTQVTTTVVQQRHHLVDTLKPAVTFSLLCSDSFAFVATGDETVVDWTDLDEILWLAPRKAERSRSREAPSQSAIITETTLLSIDTSHHGMEKGIAQCQAAASSQAKGELGA